MSYPHLTVAVVCRQDSKVLMVNEIDNGINCWNQPAGHVEDGESLERAAIRETREETGYTIELTGLLGLYQGIHQQSGTHFVRVCFTASALTKATAELDSDIIQAQWLPLDDLLANRYPLRSQITRKTLEDLGNVPIYPLSMIKSLDPGGLA